MYTAEVVPFCSAIDTYPGQRGYSPPRTHGDDGGEVGAAAAGGGEERVQGGGLGAERGCGVGGLRGITAARRRSLSIIAAVNPGA